MSLRLTDKRMPLSYKWPLGRCEKILKTHNAPLVLRVHMMIHFLGKDIIGYIFTRFCKRIPGVNN